jgi:hypothetical protein
MIIKLQMIIMMTYMLVQLVILSSKDLVNL